jgi:hypothetical protein
VVGYRGWAIKIDLPLLRKSKMPRSLLRKRSAISKSTHDYMQMKYSGNSQKKSNFYRSRFNESI